MLLASLSAVFALIFGTLAYRGIPHGLTLTRIGWQALNATADKPDTTTNIERYRILSDGNRFFLAGLGWLIMGVVSAILAVLTTLLTLYFAGIF
jgi:hypothetical protein